MITEAPKGDLGSRPNCSSIELEVVGVRDIADWLDGQCLIDPAAMAASRRKA